MCVMGHDCCFRGFSVFFACSRFDLADFGVFDEDE